MKALETYYRKTYRRAEGESAIHWHREEPPALLKKALTAIDQPASALDIGCGTGVNAVFMAQHGLTVTAIDYVPEALKFASARGERAGVRIEFISADVVEFDPGKRFDLILDSGCFHGFDERLRRSYRVRLMSWLNEGAQYVLVHSGKRHPFDLSIVGTRARRREDVERFFAPELKLEDFAPGTGGRPLFEYRFMFTAR